MLSARLASNIRAAITAAGPDCSRQDADVVAATVLASLDNAHLLELWAATETQLISPELADVRGWIMGALELHDPDAFVAWVDSPDAPDKYFA